MAGDEDGHIVCIQVAIVIQVGRAELERSQVDGRPGGQAQFT
jgi:hypothetical protein